MFIIMFIFCSYNPKKDVGETVVGLSIDVFESVKTGVVMPASKESFYNALDEIEKVGRRVKDIFDVMEAQGILSKQISESTAESGKTD